MSRFKKQSHTIWFCEYHVVWCPKYRYRVLAGKVKEEVELCVRDQTQQMECEVVELNVQADHVHLVVLIPPKVRIADYMGRLKGKTAIRLFSVFRDLRRRPYWGNHFWVEGYVLLRFCAHLGQWSHSFTRLFALIRSALWQKLELRSLLECYGTAGGGGRFLGTPQQAYLAGFG